MQISGNPSPSEYSPSSDNISTLAPVSTTRPIVPKLDVYISEETFIAGSPGLLSIIINNNSDQVIEIINVIGPESSYIRHYMRYSSSSKYDSYESAKSSAKSAGAEADYTESKTRTEDWKKTASEIAKYGVKIVERMLPIFGLPTVEFGPADIAENREHQLSIRAGNKSKLIVERSITGFKEIHIRVGDESEITIPELATEDALKQPPPTRFRQQKKVARFSRFHKK